jgi:Zn-dependent M28 family amino/carboxypeptidase
MRHRNGEPADHWERPIAVAVVGILVLTCLVWILILTGCGGDGPAGPDLPPDVVAAEATITAVDLAARVGALAHDSMRGRATPSPELEAAARWAASEFASFGLQAEGDVGYLQWYLAAPGDPAEAVNGIGRLAGSDPALRDEFVVIAAHFDHLGVGEPVAEDSVYNGADDNGSGTAAVLELAEAFASLATPPRRSVLFVLFSGEERGLLGSSYYSEHPAAPMASTTAMINLDMLGRNWPDRVAAVYQPESDIFERAERVAGAHPGLGMDLVTDPWPEENLLFRSDQVHFVLHGVPVLFLTSGLHSDYHQPSDEPDTLDFEKMSRLVRLVLWIGWDLADATSPPGFAHAVTLDS